MGSSRPPRVESRWRRRLLLASALALGVALAIFLDIRSAPASVEPSRCYGRVGAGWLEHGWKLPRRGDNFRAYSTWGWGLGRTYVHSEVYPVVLAAYQTLAEQQPHLQFVYGETGWRHGGRFRPHRTHQTGSSVDFMVPVRDREGKPTELPTGPHNQWGYAIDFDEGGRLADYSIDFEALAAHLAALKRAAAKRKLTIVKVVLYPPFRKQLATTTHWEQIATLPFTRQRSWVRHDDHYHVDFGVRCQRTK